MKTSTFTLGGALAAALVALTVSPAAADAGPITLSEPRPFYNTPFTISGACDPGEPYVVQLRYAVGGPAYRNIEGVADASTGALSVTTSVTWHDGLSVPGNRLDVSVYCSPELTDPYSPAVADPADRADLTTTFGDAALPITVTGDAFPGSDLAVSGEGCAPGESVLLSTWATTGASYVDRTVTADGAGSFAGEEIGIDPGIPAGTNLGVGYFCGGSATTEPWHYGIAFRTLLAAPASPAGAAPPAPPESPATPELPSAAVDELAETGPATTAALPLGIMLLLGGAAVLGFRRRMRARLLS